MVSSNSSSSGSSPVGFASIYSLFSSPSSPESILVGSKDGRYPMFSREDSENSAALVLLSLGFLLCPGGEFSVFVRVHSEALSVFHSKCVHLTVERGTLAL